MKTIDKIIESQEAPKDKNVLWVKGDKLLSHVNGKWTPVGGGGSASAKNQDKSVEIVENGVTEVTADSGYTGLGKVTINANVQGGGSSSGEEKVEYFAYNDLPKGMFLSLLYLVSASVKFLDSDTGSLFLCPQNIAGGLGLVIGTPLAFKFLPDEKIYVEGEQMTLLDFVTKQGGKSDYDVVPRITESEFYDVNNLHQ